MKMVVLTRPLSIKELRISRVLAPLIQHGRVIYLYEHPNERIEFVNGLVRSGGFLDQHLESYTARPVQGMTPSDFYWHLVDQDEYIQTVYIADVVNGVYKHIDPASKDHIKEMVNRLDGELK